VPVGRAMCNSRKIAYYMSHCRKCKNDPFKTFCRREVRMLIKMLILGPKIAVLRTNLLGGGMKVLRNSPTSLPQQVII
jgi:hypothetical protein